MNTVVTELLDALGIAYRRLPHDREVMTMEMAAAQRDVNPDEMVKCILLRDSKKRYVMACLLGFDRLNTQAVRQYADVSRLSFASAEEIEAVTGFGMGAVAPIGSATVLPVVFDNRINGADTVNISSGDHRLGLELARAYLVRAIENLVWGDIRIDNDK